MQKAPYDIVIFLVAVSALILVLAAFIIGLVFLYRKKQRAFEKELTLIKEVQDKAMLSAQVEMQEQTLQHISREIHDNISLSLTLTKLQLTTINWDDKAAAVTTVDNSLANLTHSIAGLSNISRSFNAEVIIQQGLLRAVEEEVERIQKAGVLSIGFTVSGSPVYVDGQRELIVFRMVQEALNNIIKHSKATKGSLTMHYTTSRLHITVKDEGAGFSTVALSTGAGLKNMQARAQMLGGSIEITSQPGAGCTINFTIPFNTL
jgi:two-component system, NarL family, sensor kinase